jgi:hypothetical protein
MEYSDKHAHIITIGDTVNVDKTEDNLEFTGTVIGFEENGHYVVVEDMDGDAFCVEEWEVEVNN